MKADVIQFQTRATRSARIQAPTAAAEDEAHHKTAAATAVNIFELHDAGRTELVACLYRLTEKWLADEPV